MAAQTVLQQVRAALGELGLPQPASVITGDQTAVQCLGLWNALGQELYENYRWKDLQAEHTFTTVAGTAAYTLPSDWAGPIDQTEWDRTNKWPLLGQKTPQEWQWLKSGIVAAGPRMRYRYNGNTLEIFPTPQDAWDIAFYYYRNGWVIKAGSPTVTTDIATADTDTTYFNYRMMVNGLKLKLWEIKGFDTTTLQKDFTRSFDQAMSRDQGAPILSLSPRPAYRYIGPWNVQDGSWVV